MNGLIKMFAIIPITCLSFALFGCDLFEVREELRVDTMSVTDITPRSAESGGDISGGGEDVSVIARGVIWDRATGPTVQLYEGKTDDGSGDGAFGSSMFWLTSGLTYHVRAYATDTGGNTTYGNEVTFQTADCDIQTGSVTDIDNNEYTTVVIGNQEWMAENLRATRYADGTPLPRIEGAEEWAALGNNNTDKAYCYPDNDPDSQYGVLYTWAGATNGSHSEDNPSGVQGICPDGWHLPSESEWRELLDYVDEKQAVALKATFGWSDEGNGMDVFGFAALPGGFRHNLTGAFPPSPDFEGNWWSTTEHVGGQANIVSMHAWVEYVYRTRKHKSLGFSVRCVKN